MQPLVKRIPFAKVEVAVVELVFKRLAESPAKNVEVAVVEVALMNPTVGEDVPTTFPEESVESRESLLAPESVNEPDTLALAALRVPVAVTFAAVRLPETKAVP